MIELTTRLRRKMTYQVVCNLCQAQQKQSDSGVGLISCISDMLTFMFTLTQTKQLAS